MSSPSVGGPSFSAPREWTRLHPVSPFLGAGPVFAAVGAYWVYTAGPQWLSGSSPDDDFADELNIGIPWLAVAGVVLAAIVIGFSHLSWRFNQYMIGDDAVYQRKGVLFRQHRQARLDRLQAVDTVQPLLGRLFGFGKVRIEVAGGKESTIELAFLRMVDAEALRNEIVALAAGVKSGEPVGEQQSTNAGVVANPALASAPAPLAGSNSVALPAPAPSLRDVIPGSVTGTPSRAAAPERVIYKVPTGRLLASIVLSWGFFFILSIPFIVFAFVVIVGDEAENVALAAVGGSLATTVPAIIGIFAYFWAQLNQGYGFTAALSPDGLRLRHGLLETRRQTVPPGRVQAVKLQQSLLWRKKDWWKVHVNVAGYQDDEQGASTLLPVGYRQEALTALWLVLPDLGDPDPAGTVSHAMSGSGEDGGFTPSPRSARVFDPFQWRHRGVYSTDRALIIRRGVLIKTVYVVPHERTQSIGYYQGPWQRALGLASVYIHSTKGPVAPVAHHMAVADARALMVQQAERAREGRVRQTPEQWMRAVGV